MSAQRAVSKIKKYGVNVIADIELESLRSAGCLCLRCTRLVTREDVEDLIDPIEQPDTRFDVEALQAKVNEREKHLHQLAKSYNCPIAQRIYEACVDGDVAAPVTRCPMFVEKE